jgi:hypothetical protein
MADIIKQEPQTNHRVDAGRQGHTAETDLSKLTVTPNVMEAEIPALPRHSSESVQQKWSVRRFDTGVVIEGKVVGRAA